MSTYLLWTLVIFIDIAAFCLLFHAGRSDLAAERSSYFRNKIHYRRKAGKCAVAGIVLLACAHLVTGFLPL